MAHSIVHCTNLQKQFQGNQIVKGVSFDVAEGEILALLGPSGCGKTTTLRLIAGLERVDSGYIEIAGTVVNEGKKHLSTEKRKVGMVFQDYALFPHLTVGQNVSFGLPKGERKKRVQEMLNLVGMGDLGDRMPSELSGGQQQRVSLARALAPRPNVLLMDEPFSNLDATLRVEMRHLVRQWVKQANITTIFVTHDQEEALEIGDKIAIMNEGAIQQLGTAEEVFHQPATRFVAEFIGETDFIQGSVTDAGIETPIGLLKQPTSTPIGETVSLAIRSDDVVIYPHETGNGVITSRRFLGIAYVYQILLDDGTTIHSWEPHLRSLQQGERILAKINCGHPLSGFIGQKLVTPL